MDFNDIITAQGTADYILVNSGGTCTFNYPKIIGQNDRKGAFDNKTTDYSECTILTG